MAKTKKQKDEEINSSNLLEKIQQLQTEKLNLKQELWDIKRKPTGKIGYVLLFFGAITFILAIISSSNIAAFVGTALVFWGGLFLFISPTKYIKKSLLEPTNASSFSNINKILTFLNFEGQGIYLPSNSTNKSETVFIPKEINKTSIPSIKDTNQSNLILEDPEGICLTPSGLGLTDLFEEELGIYFQESNLQYFEDDLKKIFVDAFEIADSFEMIREENNIHVIISNSIFDNSCKQLKTSNEHTCKRYSCPICSSIACALVRVTGQPVTIESTSLSPENESMHIYLKLHGKQKTEIQFSTKEKEIIPIKSTQKIEPLISIRLLFTLIPAIIGSSILAGIAWIAWIDMTVWNKDVVTSLFQSRIGEAISLGIGMRGIHYLIIGLGFFIPYIFIILNRTQTKQQEEL